MGRDVLAAIAHPAAEFENAVFWPQDYVSAHVVEKLWTADVGEDLAVAWLIDRKTPARVIGRVPYLELLLSDRVCVMDNVRGVSHRHTVLQSLVSCETTVKYSGLRDRNETTL